MRNYKNIFLLITAILLLAVSGCRPDEEYFARPDSLYGTINTQLESMGNFTYYLEALNRTPYGPLLAKSGSWTVCAPNDVAFKAYLQENGYSSVKTMPWSKVSAIVKYSLLSGSYNAITLTFSGNTWYEGMAFRKRTLFKDTIVEMDANDYPNYQYWQNRKYMVDPSYNRYKTNFFWIKSYLTNVRGFGMAKLSDLQFLYGRNINTDTMWVRNAKVLRQDIAAENGTIYELDRVLEPLPNLYENLTLEEYGGKYSMFKNLIDRFAYFQFWQLKNNPVTGGVDSIFRQQFQTGLTSNYLAFAPNDENMPFILSVQDRTEDACVGWTVPTNDALSSFLSSSILGQYYSSYDEMSQDVLGMFLNVNFYRLWADFLPSTFGNTFNLGLEVTDLQLSDIEDVKFTSNGTFYGVNKVYLTKNFSTVIGPMILDTSFSIMYKQIKDLGIESGLKGTGIKYSLIGVKNTQFVDVPDPNSATRLVSVVAYEPDLSVIYLKVTGDPTGANNRTYPVPGAEPSAADLEYVSTTLKSIILNLIIDAQIDLGNDNYYLARSGEMVFVSGGTKMQGGGDIYNATTSNIISVNNMVNGDVFYMSDIIKTPTNYVWRTLVDNGPDFSMFLDALTGADLKIQIVGNNNDFLLGLLDGRKAYTLFAPNNTAVQEAVTDGVIPDPSPAYLNTLTPLERAAARVKLLDFVKKHFVFRSVPTDGTTSGLFRSLYVKAIIDLVPQYQEYTIVNNYSTSSLDLKDPDTGQLLLSTGSKVNMLSSKVVIHEINTYLR